MKKAIQTSAVLAIALVSGSAYAYTPSGELPLTQMAARSVQTNNNLDPVSYKHNSSFLKAHQTKTSIFQTGCSCELCQAAREYRF